MLMATVTYQEMQLRNLNALILDGCGMCDARLQTQNQCTGNG